MLALPAEQLRGLTGDVTQARKDRSGRGQQPVLSGCRGQLAEAWAQDETTLQVSRHQAMVLEADRETMGCRPGEPGCLNQAGERRGPGLERREYVGGLVKNADSARVVHGLILPSRHLR